MKGDIRKVLNYCEISVLNTLLSMALFRKIYIHATDILVDLEEENI